MMAAGVATERGWIVRICPNVVLVTVAMICLLYLTRLGAAGAGLFLLSGLVLLGREPTRTLWEARSFVLPMLLCGFCVASTLWSNYPAVTLRYSVQLTLTFMIAIAIANRLSPIALLKIATVAYILAGIGSLVIGRAGENGIWFGIFESKNAFAQASTVLVVAGVAWICDRAQSVTWRLAGLFCVALGLAELVMAQSAGALIATMGTVLLMLTIMTMRRMTRLQRAFVATLAMAGMVGMVLFLTGYFEEFSHAFLQLTGKDVTLTGRTELWEIAFGQIQQHPLLGQGYKAVWVRGNPLAEALWSYFDIKSRSGFHFHNTMISNAVEIGVAGVLLQAGLFLSGLVFCVAWALRSPRAEVIFLAGLMLRQLLLMHSEVVFFTQFDAMSLLTVVAFVFGLRAARQEKTRAALRRHAAEGRLRVLHRRPVAAQ